MHFAQEIETYFRSRCTCICIVSFEEERILQQLKGVCEQNKHTLYTWDHADFFQHLTGSANAPPAAKEVRGVKGEQCLPLTAKLEELLGGAVVERLHTDEFHEAEQQQSQSDWLEQRGG